MTLLRSYNGWTASKDPKDFGGIQALVVAGESFSPGVRKGNVHTAFSWLANQLHTRVEPIFKAGWHEADEWGWNFRLNRNDSNLSCHSSATAIDYNATRHPNGKSSTFSPSQVREIRAILAEAPGIFRWGGDFGGTKDEMHWEIICTPDTLERWVRGLLAASRSESRPLPSNVSQAVDGRRAPTRLPVLRKGDSGLYVVMLQHLLGFEDRDCDGKFGDGTAASVGGHQDGAGLRRDEAVGQQTWCLSLLLKNGPLSPGPNSRWDHTLLQCLVGFALGSKDTDGIFGNGTLGRANETQRWGNIPVTPLIDMTTACVLARA